MLKIRIADIVVQIDNQYEEIKHFCSKYQIKDMVPADIVVFTCQEERDRIKGWFLKEEHRIISDGYAEADGMQHKIYPCLPEFNAFWLHACVVEVEGEAYAFSAPSGYGKTTHVKLWKQLLGEKARIINGDNPVIRLKDGIFYAYGTPWCGKEGWSENRGVPLKAACYIEHSEDNRLEQLESLSAYYRLKGFSAQYQKQKNIDKMLTLYEKLVESIPFYQMNCNMEPEAAKVSYEGMSGRKVKENVSR